jgi:hypothetical protein
MIVARSNESIVFYDRLNLSRLVLLIKRAFVQDEEVLKPLSDLSLGATAERRGVRVRFLPIPYLMALIDKAQKDDPGKMANLGYTAGALDQRELTSATDRFTKSKTEDERFKQQDLDNGAWLTLLWNVMLSSLPRISTGDYEDTISKLRLPQMLASRDDEYDVKLGSIRYRFTNGKPAPPATVAAWNYARYGPNRLMIMHTAGLFIQIHRHRHRHQCKRLQRLIHLRKQRQSCFW